MLIQSILKRTPIAGSVCYQIWSFYGKISFTWKGIVRKQDGQVSRNCDYFFNDKKAAIFWKIFNLKLFKHLKNSEMAKISLYFAKKRAKLLNFWMPASAKSIILCWQFGSVMAIVYKLCDDTFYEWIVIFLRFVIFYFDLLTVASAKFSDICGRLFLLVRCLVVCRYVLPSSSCCLSHRRMLALSSTTPKNQWTTYLSWIQLPVCTE